MLDSSKSFQIYTSIFTSGPCGKQQNFRNNPSFVFNQSTWTGSLTVNRGNYQLGVQCNMTARNNSFQIHHSTWTSRPYAKHNNIRYNPFFTFNQTKMYRKYDFQTEETRKFNMIARNKTFQTNHSVFTSVPYGKYQNFLNNPIICLQSDHMDRQNGSLTEILDNYPLRLQCNMIARNKNFKINHSTWMSHPYGKHQSFLCL